MLKTVSALAALAATSLAFAAPAYAGSTKTVSFEDLNLASASGRAALDNRLDRAAKSVCAVGESLELSAYIASKNCYTASIADARSAAEVAIAKNAGASVSVASR
jgi:UrcA family protein